MKNIELGTSVTKKKNLPREVHIKFTKKLIRDQILFKTKSHLKIKEHNILILKRVPWRVRKRRK